VIRLACNQGKGAALKAGFAWALERKFRAALTLDGDGQHDTDEIPLFVEAFAKTGCELVVGNRMSDLESMPRVRRWSNRFSSWAISRLAGQKLSDTQCGYRLISMAAWNVLSLDARRYELESEILIRAARHGLRIAQIPIKTIYFTARRSKIRPIVDSLRLLRTLWRCRA
jgi:glycosyltransferase involved in cell wall biosynthesis